MSQVMETMTDIASHVEYRAWSVRDVVRCMNGGGRGHIVIPSFQRGLIWNEDKRLKFVDSIKKGFPVGVILLFADGMEGGGRPRYRLVDGLQRCSTLKRYVDDMFQYFTLDEVPEALVQAASRLDPGTPNPDTKNALIRQAVWLWVREHKARETAHLSALGLYQRLCSALGVGMATIDQQVFSGCERFVHDVHEQLDIREKQIGVIEFTGDKGDLPLIFDRLNTGGVFLNKYDVLAADWDSVDEIEISNDQIVNAIKDKYREFMKLGLEFEGRTGESVDDFNSRDFVYTLFEFVFGMGRVLRARFPKLYGGRREGRAEVDTIGFNLAALTNGHPVAQLGKFKDDFRNYPRIERYFDAVVECSESVQRIMGDVLEVVIDKPRRKPWHSDFQMAALVAGVFRERYEKDLRQKSSWVGAALQIRNALPERYLFDIVSAAWRGSGDSKAFAFVDNERIKEGVDAESMSSALDVWFWESIKLSTRKDELDSIGELLLKYAGAVIRRHHPDLSATFAPIRVVEEERLRPLGWRTWNAANVLLACNEGATIFDPCRSLESPVGDSVPMTADVKSWMEERFAALSELVISAYF